MANIDLSQYGITVTTEIVYNTSYELLFKEETDSSLEGFEKGEESTLKDTKYELLVVVANQGYTEYIMEAARSANAAGGTVIHAKGTGMQKAEQFLGFSLATEKEMILIVVKNCDKNAIMKAIMEKAGLESKAKSIVFSLTVTETAGMRLVEDE